MQPFGRIARRQALVCPTRLTARPFSHAQPLRLKEDKSQSAAEIEKAKQEQLKDGKAKEELQSHSEAGVQADREKVHDHDEHMERLQNKTARVQEKEHPEGKA